MAKKYNVEDVVDVKGFEAWLNTLKATESALKDIIALSAQKTEKATGISAAEVRAANQAIKEAEAAQKALNEAEKQRIVVEKELEKLQQEKLKTERQEIATRQALEKEVKKNTKATEDEVSAYKKLSQQYNEAAKSARDLSVQYGVNSAEAQEAVLAANNLNKKLKEVDFALGNYHRNVGNYRDGMFAFTQVLREAPAFANSMQTGMMAISNNLPMLTDEIKRARDAGQSWMQIIKLMSSSIFGFSGLILIITTALTFLPKIFKQNTDEQKKNEEQTKKNEEALKKLNEEQANLIKKHEEFTLSNIEYLNTLRMLSEGTIEYKNSIDSLNEGMQNYLNTADELKLTSKSIVDQILAINQAQINKGVIENLNQQISSRAAQLMMIDKEIDKLGILNKSQKDAILTSSKYMATISENDYLSGKYNKTISDISQNTIDNIDATEMQREELNDLVSEYSVVLRQLVNLDELYKKFTKNLKNSSYEVDKNKDKTEKYSKSHYSEYKKMLQSIEDYTKFQLNANRVYIQDLDVVLAEIRYNFNSRYEHIKRINELEGKSHLKLIRDKISYLEDMAKRELMTDEMAKELAYARIEEENEIRRIRSENIEKGLKLIDTIYDKYHNKQIERIDKQIEASKNQQETLRMLAAQGSEDAKNNLAFEEANQIKLEAIRRKQQEQQKRIEFGMAIIKSYNEKVGAGDKMALQHTMTDAIVLQSFIKSLPSLFDGTFDTGEGGTLDDKGGHLAVLHKNEAVVDAANMSKVRDAGIRTNEEFVAMALSGKNAINKQIKKDSEFDKIANKLDKLVKLTEDKPVYVGSDYDSISHSIVQVYETSTEIRRNHKRLSKLG